MSKSSGFGFFPEVITDPAQLRQTIYQESSTQKHSIGAQFRDYRAGQTRLFRYCLVGGSNVSKGMLMQGPAPIANHQEHLGGAGTVGAVGDRSVQVGLTMTTALTANQYDNGMIHFNLGTGLGGFYPIKSHTNTVQPLIELHEPLAEAIDTTTEISLTLNQNNGIIVAPTTLTGPLVGIPVIDLTAGYYGWVQTGGDAAALVDTAETMVIGEIVGYPGTISVAGAVGFPADTDPIIGVVRAVNVAAEYALIKILHLDV